MRIADVNMLTTDAGAYGACHDNLSRNFKLMTHTFLRFLQWGGVPRLNFNRGYG